MHVVVYKLDGDIASFTISDARITKELVQEYFKQATEEQEFCDGEKNIHKHFITHFTFLRCEFDADAFEPLNDHSPFDYLQSSKVEHIYFSKKPCSEEQLKKIAKELLRIPHLVKVASDNSSSQFVRINNILQDWLNKWRLKPCAQHDEAMKELLIEYEAILLNLSLFKLWFASILKEGYVPPTNVTTNVWEKMPILVDIIWARLVDFKAKVISVDSPDARALEVVLTELMLEVKMYVEGECVKKEDTLIAKDHYFRAWGKYLHVRHIFLSMAKVNIEADKVNVEDLIGKFYKTEPLLLVAADKNLHLMNCAMRALFIAHIYYLKDLIKLESNAVKIFLSDGRTLHFLKALKRVDVVGLPSIIINDLSTAIISFMADKYHASLQEYDLDQEKGIQLAWKMLQKILKANAETASARFVFCLLQQAIYNAERHPDGGVIKCPAASKKLQAEMHSKLLHLSHVFFGAAQPALLMLDGCYSDQLWMSAMFLKVRMLGMSVLGQDNLEAKLVDCFRAFRGYFLEPKLFAEEYLDSLSGVKARSTHFDFDPYTDIAYAGKAMQVAHCKNVISTFNSLYNALNRVLVQKMNAFAQVDINIEDLMGFAKDLLRFGEMLNQNAMISDLIDKEHLAGVLDICGGLTALCDRYESIKVTKANIAEKTLALAVAQKAVADEALQKAEKERERQAMMKAEREKKKEEKRQAEIAAQKVAQVAGLERKKAKKAALEKAKMEAAEKPQVQEEAFTEQKAQEAIAEVADNLDQTLNKETECSALVVGLESFAANEQFTPSSQTTLSRESATASDVSEAESTASSTPIHPPTMDVIQLNYTLLPVALFLQRLNAPRMIDIDIHSLVASINVFLGPQRAHIWGDYVLEQAFKERNVFEFFSGSNQVEVLVALLNPAQELDILKRQLPYFQFIEDQGKLVGSFGDFIVHISFFDARYATVRDQALKQKLPLNSLLMGDNGEIYDLTLWAVNDLLNNKVSLWPDFYLKPFNSEAILKLLDLAIRFNLTLDAEVVGYIQRNMHRLNNSSPHLLRRHFMSYFQNGKAVAAFELLLELNLFAVFLPKLHEKIQVGIGLNECHHYCLTLDQDAQASPKQTTLIAEFLRIAYAGLLFSRMYTQQQKIQIIWNDLLEAYKSGISFDLSLPERKEIVALIRQRIPQHLDARVSTLPQALFAHGNENPLQTGRLNETLEESGMSPRGLLHND